MRTYLQVPFSEKDNAKKNGARWDGIKKSWYIEDVDDLKPFMKWMPAHLIKPHRDNKRMTNPDKGIL